MRLNGSFYSAGELLGELERSMMKSYVTLIFCFALLVPAFASGQELWNGSRVGMSSNDVLAAIPAARLLPTPIAKGIGDQLVVADNISVLGYRATAEFYFRSNRLRIVQIRISPLWIKVETFALLEAGLTEKYGQSSHCNGPKWCVWDMENVFVGLIESERSETTFPTIIISYDSKPTFAPL